MATYTENLDAWEVLALETAIEGMLRDGSLSREHGGGQLLEKIQRASAISVEIEMSEADLEVDAMLEGIFNHA